ncbi:MAG TPA: terminase [Alphaproteobacteria bacterium]|nr:terminase [Alphaproteobacteria bacterium]
MAVRSAEEIRAYAELRRRHLLLKRQRSRAVPVAPIRSLPWTPLPGPQTQGYESPADILYFGGAAGGGKTFLLLGLAVTSHRRSIIFRREYKQLAEIEEKSQELITPDYGRYNGQRMRWRLYDGRLIEFGAVQHPGDERGFQGRRHDLLAFDEIAHFLESQFRFLSGWLGTTVPGQRCRIVATGNPPTEADGEWVLQYWGPWLDPQHPHPAQPGERRWYATIDGKDIEREDGSPFVYQGETITPMSRTFIPAHVEDNPYLMQTGYKTILQNLPEPLRSKLLYGNHAVSTGDNPWQVIPTAWIDAAMARWTEQRPDLPLTAMGVDIARGGPDQTVIAKRYGPWIAPLKKYPGWQTPDGPSVATLVVIAHEGSAPIHIDIIGVGGSGYDHVKSVKGKLAVPMNGAERDPEARDRSGQLAFRNKRAEWHWRLREALDPVTGEGLALPPDRELRADLMAPRWKLSAQGIQIEDKDEIKARLGRSPDCGEAVIYACAPLQIEEARWLFR